MKFTKKNQDLDNVVRDLVEYRHPGFKKIYYAIADELDMDETDAAAADLAIRNEALSPTSKITTLSEEQRKLLDEALDLKDEFREKPEAELRFRLSESRASSSPSRDLDDQWLFFNEARCVADFFKWSKMATWSAEEAASLCLGKAPEVVNATSLLPFVGRSAFVQRYNGLRTLIERAVQAAHLGTGLPASNPIDPERFIAWARQMEIELPPEMIKAVSSSRKAMEEREASLAQLRSERDELVKRVEELQAQDDEKELGKVERRKFLTMIAGMSRRYDFDPSKNRSNVAARIESDVKLAGLAISQDTILLKLRQAEALRAKISGGENS